MKYNLNKIYCLKHIIKISHSYYSTTSKNNTFNPNLDIGGGGGDDEDHKKPFDWTKLFKEQFGESDSTSNNEKIERLILENRKRTTIISEKTDQVSSNVQNQLNDLNSNMINIQNTLNSNQINYNKFVSLEKDFNLRTAAIRIRQETQNISIKMLDEKVDQKIKITESKLEEAKNINDNKIDDIKNTMKQQNVDNSNALEQVKIDTDIKIEAATKKTLDGVDDIIQSHSFTGIMNRLLNFVFTFGGIFGPEGMAYISILLLSVMLYSFITFFNRSRNTTSAPIIQHQQTSSTQTIELSVEQNIEIKPNNTDTITVTGEINETRNIIAKLLKLINGFLKVFYEKQLSKLEIYKKK